MCRSYPGGEKRKCTPGRRNSMCISPEGPAGFRLLAPPLPQTGLLESGPWTPGEAAPDHTFRMCVWTSHRAVVPPQPAPLSLRCLSFLWRAGTLACSVRYYAHRRQCLPRSTVSTSVSCWCDSRFDPTIVQPMPLGPRAQLFNHHIMPSVGPQGLGSGLHGQKQASWWALIHIHR